MAAKFVRPSVATLRDAVAEEMRHARLMHHAATSCLMLRELVRAVHPNVSVKLVYGTRVYTVRRLGSSVADMGIACHIWVEADGERIETAWEVLDGVATLDDPELVASTMGYYETVESALEYERTHVSPDAAYECRATGTGTRERWVEEFMELDATHRNYVASITDTQIATEPIFRGMLITIASAFCIALPST